MNIDESTKDVRGTFDGEYVYYSYMLGIYAILLLELFLPGYDSFLSALNYFVERVGF